jgi:excisionase family DNA binding protein
MTAADFRAWLLARIDELDALYDRDQHEGTWERCAAIAAEAGNRAARLGFADLHQQSTRFGAMADVQPVKTYLAACLASVAPPDAAGALMTASEAIAYLRLDVDDRNPAERLRNLVRRQRLPCVRRGRLILFSRTAVDAWLASRK